MKKLLLAALLAFAPTRSDVAFARWELGRPVFRGDRLALAARRDAPAAAVAGLGRLPRGARLRRR